MEKLFVLKIKLFPTDRTSASRSCNVIKHSFQVHSVIFKSFVRVRGSIRRLAGILKKNELLPIFHENRKLYFRFSWIYLDLERMADREKLKDLVFTFHSIQRNASFWTKCSLCRRFLLNYGELSTQIGGPENSYCLGLLHQI